MAPAPTPPEWNFGHVAGVCDVSFIGSGEDARLVTCGADSTVTLRHPDTAEVEESFTEDHEDAVNVVAVAPDGAKFATGSDDNCVKLFNFAGVTREFESNVVRFQLPVRALAYSADGTLLAAGGEDSTVKVIKMDDRSVAHELATRSKCTKSVAFDPKGDYLSAVDDTGVLTVWALRAITDDDNDDDAADADADADDEDDKKAAAEPGEIVLSATTAPVTEPDSPAVNRAAWRPDGAVLAIPGRERDVTFFERGTWTELEDFRLLSSSTEEDVDAAAASKDAKNKNMEGHTDNVVLVAWSPNGKYLLTSGKDNVIAVWDVGSKKIIARLAHESVVCGASWKGEGNAVALVDADGQWTVWKNPVPGSMTSPTAVVAAEELDFFHAGRSVNGTKSAGAAGGAAGVKNGVGAEGEYLDGDDDDDDAALGDMDEEEYYAEMERRRKMKRKMAAAAKALAGEAAVAGMAAAPTPQPAFQVGSVSASAAAAADNNSNNNNKNAAGAGPNRRFLCYNMMGTIVSTGEPGSDFNSVEMAFHDQSRAGRIPTITDYHGYSLGFLGERGCALASPGKPGGAPSSLFYRPYESWAHASEWRVTLPAGEEAAAVAAGSSWVAVVTSQRMLRVFSHAGAQRQMVTLEGAPVTCCGKGKSLVVAWHAAAPALVPGTTGGGGGGGGGGEANSVKQLQVEQRIEFAEYDVSNGGRVMNRGKLPIPPGHTLTWMGHVEDGSGALAFAASDGVIRVRTPDFGGSWTPVFRSADARKQEGEHHWTVAVSTADTAYASSAVYCVVCRSAAGPAVHPKPVLTPLQLSMPVALPDASTGDLEDAAAKAQLSVSLAAAAAAAAAAAENVTHADEAELSAAADALRAAQAAADKAALRLFHASCRGEKPTRAADVAAGLHLPASMHGALKLANAMSQGALAERVTHLIEANMAAAASAAAAAADVYGGSGGISGGGGGGYGEASQLNTPGQAPHQHYSAPPSYVAPTVPSATTTTTVVVEDANPFARRKSSVSAAAVVAPAEEDDDENHIAGGGNIKGGGQLLAGTKTKAGYEANAAPPAKKGRSVNPFARR